MPDTSLRVAEQIEAIIQQSVPTANVGIVLEEAKTGRVLYERLSAKPFCPASNVKLLTAAASLLSLGSDYRFKTVIKIENKALQQGKLLGNVFIEFNGDPSLTILDFKELLSGLKKAGIRQITGDIVIDNTRFEKPNYAPGWTWDSLPWYYTAPVTAVILNENYISLIVRGNKTTGKKAQISFVDGNEGKIKVISELVSVSEFAANNECQIQAEMNDQNDLSLKGCWPYQTQATTLSFAIKNPDLYATRLIIEVLKSENIELMGKVIIGKAPLNLKIIASHESKPLTELLKEVLRESNNIYADSLFKTLGAEKFQYGTFQAGTRAIQAVLAKPTGIRFADLRIVDGSGASRYNLVAPQDFARLLLTMYHDNKVGKDFINALTSSGDENGNLRYRMGSADLKDKIRAKTGTLLGISALAGYLSVHDKDFIVVIAIDHALQNGEYLKHVEDELCRVLVNFD